MLGSMKRWGILLVLVAVGVAARIYARPPAPQSIRAAVKPAPDAPVARGRLVYERYGCMLCHGPDGKGGLANPNALRDAKIPSLLETADTFTLPEVEQAIRFGRPRIDRADEKGVVPPYRMPGWRDRMSDQEVNDLAQYVLNLAPKGAKKSGWGK
jgi:mono/diheme cytochrome c family protein